MITLKIHVSDTLVQIEPLPEIVEWPPLIPVAWSDTPAVYEAKIPSPISLDFDLQGLHPYKADIGSMISAAQLASIPTSVSNEANSASSPQEPPPIVPQSQGPILSGALLPIVSRSCVSEQI